MTTLAVVGECMLEYLAAQPERPPAASGDTYNTAVYAARTSCRDHLDISYVTALGDDAGSDTILRAMRAEGIDTEQIVRLPGRSAGTYRVHTDAAGERSFTYQRAHSAATELFGSHFPDRIDEWLTTSDVIYLSGITLQIMTTAARSRLVACLARARGHGATIVFDSNYRAVAWASPDAARSALEEVTRITDIALPSFTDEAALFGDPDPASCADRLEAAGVTEIVVKDGGRPAYVRAGGESSLIPPRHTPTIVDTTAAGDSFNAAYLTARLTGHSPWDAVPAGHALASLVVQHHGAVIPYDLLPARETSPPLHAKP
ncbi:sugar kinase [Embleya scabrispora]|uniref:sugar kinase n=1 Tax=Embleya scabrispora TaxID=159449 RepID=UPI0003757871|nr:sugar kinase [Embleya scabrispora]MYS86564.1 sugar kinase [Streptomyces sp. SID5474]